MKPAGTYLHFEGTYRGVYRGGKVASSLGTHTFKEMDWLWLEITPVIRLSDRNVPEERVLDFYFAPQLPKRSTFRVAGQHSTNVIIVGPERKAFSGTVYDVVMTQHTLGPENAECIIREPNGKQVAKDAMEMTGTIRFSLPDITAPANTLSQSSIPQKESSFAGRFKKGFLSRFIPAKTALNYTNLQTGMGDPIPESHPQQNPIALPKRSSNWLTGIIGLIFVLILIRWIPILGVIALVVLIVNAISSKKGSAPTSGNDQVGCRSLFIWLLAGATCFHAWGHAPRPIFYGLLFISLLHMASRVQTRNGWKGIIGIVTLFALIGYWSQYLNIDWRKYFDPRKEEGRARIEPPVPVEVTDSDGNKKIDSLFQHEVHWDDFVHRNYHERYGTTLGQYSQSSNMHAALAQVDAVGDVRSYWASIYRALVTNDSNKLDSLANYFKEQRDSLHLNPNETAEVVVAFIQEIPYYLVHEGSCSMAMNSGNDFMKQYHLQGKPCLAHMVAGIQGPYEFIHNLKGDCDTRSLLCHSLLTKLGIPSSVWVSEAYGHSIIGIGVAGSGNNYKTVSGQRHFATELTAKGFRVGMISPDHTDMDNWLITITNK